MSRICQEWRPDPVGFSFIQKICGGNFPPQNFLRQGFCQKRLRRKVSICLLPSWKPSSCENNYCNYPARRALSFSWSSACPVKPSFVIVSPGFRSRKGKNKNPLRSSRLGGSKCRNCIGWLVYMSWLNSFLDLFDKMRLQNYRKCGFYYWSFFVRSPTKR